MYQIKLLGIIFCVSFLISACDDSPTGPEEEGDRIVEGVNITKLFAEPTSTEISAILLEWEGRDAAAEGIQELLTAPLLLGTAQATLRVVSHTVGGVQHFGVIVAPAGASPASLPVLIYTHGGDSGVNIDETLVFLPFALGGIGDDFVYVVPSFRSESLIFDGNTYQSGGEPSPWDLDVDDALALLNVALETTPEADPTRIGVVGFSRGANVGMLMAVRDPRIDLIVEFFGPTDFLGPYVQELVEEALQGNPRDLPGLDHLNRTFIQPLMSGALTIEDVRPELLRRSPVYFADRLPQLQGHHGTLDVVVDVSQAERLIEVMEQLGRSEPEFEFYLYEGGTHNPLSLPGSIDRSAEFLSRLFAPLIAAQ
ncbi:MAG: peptidase [Bacteroidota bacterium]